MGHTRSKNITSNITFDHFTFLDSSLSTRRYPSSLRNCRLFGPVYIARFVHSMVHASYSSSTPNLVHKTTNSFMDPSRYSVTIFESAFDEYYLQSDVRFTSVVEARMKKHANTCPTDNEVAANVLRKDARNALRDARSNRNCGHDGNAPASSA